MGTPSVRVQPSAPEIFLLRPKGGRTPASRSTRQTPSSSPTPILSPAHAFAETALPAHGGRARRPLSDRGRVAVRAEVGRLSRHPRECRGQAPPVEPQRAPAAPLLPRAD